MKPTYFHVKFKITDAGKLSDNTMKVILINGMVHYFTTY